jgi:hypothetical protein
VPYQAFTFLFKPTPHGLFRVHAYRYHEHGSTFIVECRDDTWRRAGLDTADEDRTVAILEAIFADELAGHRLIKNRSIWRNFPTVRCGQWHAGDTVLLGDAAHTAHFSIGSGTKLAMEDAIALVDELLGATAIAAALTRYEARRRPEVEALQAAAQASLEWFEGTERYARMAPVQFTYSLMTRSLRVSHASVGKRDPHLARGVERLLAASVGATAEPAPPPTALPFVLGDRRARSRIALLPPLLDPTGRSLAEAARAGAGLVVTPALPLTGDAVARWLGEAAAWRRIVDEIHGAGALIAARFALTGAAPEALTAAVAHAARIDVDVILLDPTSRAPGDEGRAAEQLPAAVAAACAVWRANGWVAAAIADRPAQVIGHAAQVVRAGAALLWVSSTDPADSAHGARLPAAAIADRLRNELGVATAIEAGAAALPDLDAAIAAGRADLVVVGAMPAGAPRS